LLLPDGRMVGVRTALTSGDEGQPLRVPMWREQRQLRDCYAPMLIHDADTAYDSADGSLGEPAVPRERPVEVEFRLFPIQLRLSMLGSHWRSRGAEAGGA
jgi:hypothetical protein